jgi:hypothetical protein
MYIKLNACVYSLHISIATLDTSYGTFPERLKEEREEGVLYYGA